MPTTKQWFANTDSFPIEVHYLDGFLKKTAKLYVNGILKDQFTIHSWSMGHLMPCLAGSLNSGDRKFIVSAFFANRFRQKLGCQIFVDRQLVGGDLSLT